MIRNITCFGETYSPEEYIEKELLCNRGTQCTALKTELIAYAEENGLAITGSMTKKEMVNRLLDGGITYRKLADDFGVGVSSNVYQETFHISHKDVKRLEQKGKLRVVGRYRFRAFGKYLYAPLYDLYQYASMTEEEMERMRKE